MKTETKENNGTKILSVILDNGNSWKAKEVSPDGTIVIFPFRYIEDADRFEPKYKKIKSIKICPKVEIKKGLYRNIKYGLGFTSKAREILDVIEKSFPNVLQIEINDHDEYCEVCDDTLKFTLKAFNCIVNDLYSTKDFHKREIKCNIKYELFSYFGDLVRYTEPIYEGDDICNRYFIYNNFEKISDKDLEIIERMIPYFSNKMKSEVLIKTKETIDTVYLEDVLSSYLKLLNLKSSSKSKCASDKIEKKWQEFFKKNSWLLAQLFYSPVTLIQNEAFVGGKGIDNKNGKLADFVYKNSLGNVAIIEIKTHLTKITESRSYRGSDVFAASVDLSGAISQILNQKHNLYLEFTHLQYNSDEKFETFNPLCVLLIGCLADLTKKQLQSFELYRNGFKDVEIVTFDELKSKIESMLSILKNEFE